MYPKADEIVAMMNERVFGHNKYTLYIEYLELLSRYVKEKGFSTLLIKNQVISNFMRLLGWNHELDYFILHFFKYLLKFSDHPSHLLEALNLESMLLDDDFVTKSPRSELTDIKRRLVKHFIISLIETNQEVPWQKVMEKIIKPGLNS